jgi:hypothetical protein
MKRLALCTIVPLLASTVGCSTLGGGSRPLIVTAARVDLTVDARAYVNHPFVEIRAGQTEIVWTAPGSVEALWIAFKPDPRGVPPNPDCQGLTCTFPTTSSVSFANREFLYSLAVKKNGAWKIHDPKLIIKP